MSEKIKVDKPEHGAPWSWEMGKSAYDRSLLELWRLADAKGESVIQSIDGGDTNLQCDSAISRELIRSAPEMEAALRKVQWNGTLPDTQGGGSCCPECECEAQPVTWGPGLRMIELQAVHAQGCSVGDVLAALDAARKAG